MVFPNAVKVMCLYVCLPMGVAHINIMKRSDFEPFGDVCIEMCSYVKKIGSYTMKSLAVPLPFRCELTLMNTCTCTHQ